MGAPHWITGQDRLWATLVAVALMGLLPLAWLQYRWIDRISQAESERMRAHLQTSVMRFGQDFDGELARLLRALLAEPPGPPDRELAGLAERWAQFNETGADSKLVRGLYAARGGDGTTELFRFDPAAAAFVPVAWPDRFQQIRNRLSVSDFPAGRPGQMGDLNLVFESIPALVVPNGRRMGGGPPPLEFRMGGFGRRPRVPGWNIVELDLDYIRNTVLPELVRKHFPQSGEDLYEVRVVAKRDPAQVVYASDPSQPAGSFSATDFRADLLNVRLGPPLERLGGPRGAWLLLVRHRGGSLEEIVERTRRRNLAISGTILLMLGGSLGALLVSTRRARSLAAQQMEFVAGVSHELRTPLTVISSAADNLADGIVASEQQARRYGTLIRSESRRLANMVEQILGFAGIQSGREKYDLQPVDVRAAVDRAVAACDPQILAAGCEVSMDVPEDLPRVQADPTSLVHCLRNLVENAVTHGAQGKWIGIRAAALDGAVEIRVEDRGPGIDPGDLRHLFDPFFRGRRTMADQAHGFGLGLALVKRIVEAHSGTIRVKSPPGKGTCFVVRIPAALNSEENVGTADSVNRG